jgi:hypothetical protein
MRTLREWPPWILVVALLSTLLLVGGALSLVEKIFDPRSNRREVAASVAEPESLGVKVEVVDGPVVQIDFGRSRHRLGIETDEIAQQVAVCIDEALATAFAGDRPVTGSFTDRRRAKEIVREVCERCMVEVAGVPLPPGPREIVEP